MRVTGFDHLVLSVADVERSLEFYCGPLGLEPVRVEEWRAGKVPFPSVRVSPETIIDIVRAPESSGNGPGRVVGGANVDHICLVVEPLDWRQAIEAGELAEFTVVDGPGERFGARGRAQSVYVRDPDGNTVELRWYPQDA
ncbi:MULTISPECIES: VOC family protein [unclassified Streptomyces]|uniref:VOC family protein n=1 Tax=unclassified Streptomyces TaxID=2593676 RepID=UPI002E1611E5|nr:VOC family protein [Streptomyces sp. NBC_01197]WSS50255.1 VOC family protein [Streptomyces sp. NBC_01180]